MHFTIHGGTATNVTAVIGAGRLDSLGAGVLVRESSRGVPVLAASRTYDSPRGRDSCRASIAMLAAEFGC